MECLELSLASCGPQPAKPWAPPVTPELPTYHEAMSPSTIWYLWRRYCAPKPRCQLSPSDLARSTLNVACDGSDERRVGQECVSTCSYRWSPDHYQKKIIKKSKTT